MKTLVSLMLAFYILFSYSYGECKLNLFNEVVIELEKFPKNSWTTKKVCGSCAPRVTLKLNRIEIDIDEVGFLYIDGNIILLGFSKRLVRIYKKIIKYNHWELRLMRALEIIRAFRKNTGENHGAK